MPPDGCGQVAGRGRLFEQATDAASGLDRPEEPAELVLGQVAREFLRGMTRRSDRSSIGLEAASWRPRRKANDRLSQVSPARGHFSPGLRFAVRPMVTYRPV